MSGHLRGGGRGVYLIRWIDRVGFLLLDVHCHRALFGERMGFCFGLEMYRNTLPHIPTDWDNSNAGR
jgi:hypothetical protein